MFRKRQRLRRVAAKELTMAAEEAAEEVGSRSTAGTARPDDSGL